MFPITNNDKRIHESQGQMFDITNYKGIHETRGKMFESTNGKTRTVDF